MRWPTFLAAVCLLAGCERTPAPPARPTAAAAPGTLVESAAERGLKFRFRDAASAAKRMYETLGGGAVLFDADGDGDLDVFFPGGGANAATPDARTHQALFHNDGQGRFTDVTSSVGLEAIAGAFAVGGAAGDVDGDGDLDLYVACLGANRLYLNDGGRFTAVAAAGGAAAEGWSAAAVFFDADADGDSDLYVVNYVAYDPADELPCTYAGVRIICTPDFFAAAPDRFYRNEGGRFVDSGTAPRPGKGLAVAAADVDGDGDLDLYVANDITPNHLLINDGRGDFTDEGLLRGAALGRNGEEKASMGVVAFDFDGDHDLDLMIPNFSNEVYDLFRQDPGGFFTEVAERQGLARETTPLLGFGVVAADFDLDGWVDLALANGHINDLADDLLHGETYRQPNLLLKNQGGRFTRWTEREGDFAVPDVARGLAAGDLDGDGDVDLVASRIRDAAALFVAAGEPGDGWIAVAPRLASGAPVAGAWITLVDGAGTERVAAVVAGGSYASQSEPVVRFGLGTSDPRELTVRWPSGTARRIVDPPRGRLLVVTAEVEEEDHQDDE